MVLWRKRVYIGKGKFLFRWEDELKGEESEGERESTARESKNIKT